MTFKIIVKIEMHSSITKMTCAGRINGFSLIFVIINLILL